MITREWVNNYLNQSFEAPIKATQFIAEKKKMLNNRLYKYCPINDIAPESDEIQYSIENVKQSILYMSRVANFNDPFDTYISFSIDDVIPSLIPSILENNTEIDESTKSLIPMVFNILMQKEEPKQKNNPLLKYLFICLKNHPGILTGTEDSSVLIVELMRLITTEMLSGNLSEDELNSFSNIGSDPNALIADLIKECIGNPQLLNELGIELDTNSSNRTKEIFEGNFPELEAAKEEYWKIIDSSKPEISEAIKKARDVINDKYYITCFSTSADNALMWAHYSNKHKGFCIEYDLSKTKDNNFLINLHPVIYSNTRASIPPSLFDFTDTNNIRISSSNQSTSDLLCAMLTKSDVWKYEDEWRLLLYDEIEKLHDNKFAVDCISKIVLGCQIEERYEREFTDICKNKGYHLSKMKLDDNTYTLLEENIF